MAYKNYDDFSSNIYESDSQLTLQADGQNIDLPDASFVRDADIMQEGADLILNSSDGSILIENYFSVENTPDLIAPDGSTLTPELVNSFAKSSLQYAQNMSMNDESPVGAIQEITGEATLTHTDGSSETIELGTSIYNGDIIETGNDGAVNIIFTDETNFAISEGSRLAIDEYVFDPATQSGSQDFSVLKGVFVFTSGLIGRDDPDDVNIDTPVGSIGIRGTIIAGDVNQGEITVIEGAIVLTDLSGNEMTLATQFETAKFHTNGHSIENQGQMSANDVGQKFASVSKVSPTLFSSVQDAVAEESKSVDTESTIESETEGEAGDEAEANPDGSLDQNNDNEVDGSINEETTNDEQTSKDENIEENTPEGDILATEAETMIEREILAEGEPLQTLELDTSQMTRSFGTGNNSLGDDGNILKSELNNNLQEQTSSDEFSIGEFSIESNNDPIEEYETTTNEDSSNDDPDPPPTPPEDESNSGENEPFSLVKISSNDVFEINEGSYNETTVAVLQANNGNITAADITLTGGFAEVFEIVQQGSTNLFNVRIKSGIDADRVDYDHLKFHGEHDNFGFGYEVKDSNGNIIDSNSFVHVNVLDVNEVVIHDFLAPGDDSTVGGIDFFAVSEGISFHHNFDKDFHDHDFDNAIGENGHLTYSVSDVTIDGTVYDTFDNALTYPNLIDSYTFDNVTGEILLNFNDALSVDINITFNITAIDGDNLFNTQNYTMNAYYANGFIPIGFNSWIGLDGAVYSDYIGNANNITLGNNTVGDEVINSKFFLGADNDTVELKSGFNNDIYLGEGNDSIDIGISDASYNNNVFTGYGYDTVNLLYGDYNYVHMDDGGGIITIGDGTNIVSYSIIHAEHGEYTIDIKDGFNNDIDLGHAGGDGTNNGTHTVTIGSSSLSSNNSIDVYAYDTNSSINIENGDQNTITLTSGENIINISDLSDGNNITGGNDTDIFNISNADNVIMGNNGDDQFIFNLDFITFTNLNNGSFDGGDNWPDFNNNNAGDMLVFSTGTAAINLDFINNSSFTNIEVIDTDNNNAFVETIILDYNNIINMTDDNNTLVIDTDNNDTLSFDTKGNLFTIVDTIETDIYYHDGETANMETFDVYTNGTVTLLVNTDTTLQIF